MKKIPFTVRGMSREVSEAEAQILIRLAQSSEPLSESALSAQTWRFLPSWLWAMSKMGHLHRLGYVEAVPFNSDPQLWRLTGSGQEAVRALQSMMPGAALA